MSHKMQVEATFYYLTNSKLLNICKSQHVYFLIKKKKKKWYMLCLKGIRVRIATVNI